MAKDEYSIGLMHEFMITAAKVGWKPKTISQLSKNEDQMKDFLRVLKGTHVIKRIKHLIDTTCLPEIPEGYEIEEHVKYLGDSFDCSLLGEQAFAYHPPDQESGTDYSGQKIVEWTTKVEKNGFKRLNATVLDYLVKNPQLIPEGWHGSILFPGTIFKSKSGRERMVGILKTCVTGSGKWVRGEWYLSKNDFYYDEYSSALLIKNR